MLLGVTNMSPVVPVTRFETAFAFTNILECAIFLSSHAFGNCTVDFFLHGN